MCRRCTEKDSLIASLKQANSEMALFNAMEISRRAALDVMEQFVDECECERVWWDAKGWDQQVRH
jgi:hypothetical protein